MQEELLNYISNSENISELKEIQSLIETRLSRLRKLELNNARKKVQDMAAELEVDVADLVPQLNKVAAKYVNPKDSSETWSGRGKRPVWLNRAIEKGAKLEDFEV